LLRHPAAVSPVKDVTKGKFQEIIEDASVTGKDAKRLVLCSGKLYYELDEVRQKNKLKDVALVRIEQLFPFPEKQLKAIFKNHKNAQVIFVQEEPLNMGYQSYMQRMLPKQEIEYIARKASASPATGYNKVHKIEQEKIINQALGL
jgi:2-oxoglutarate dehydrogenase E1 component